MITEIERLTPEAKYYIDYIQAMTIGTMLEFERAIKVFDIMVYDELDPADRLLALLDPREGDIWQREDGNTYYYSRGNWATIFIPANVSEFYYCYAGKAEHTDANKRLY
jgi:hypothetical protein